MNPIQKLKDKVASNIHLLNSEILHTPFEDPQVYANYMAQTYYFVCHSTRLLSLASAHFPEEMDHYHYRFAKHVEEERGHEKLALHDLKTLGYQASDFPESSETKAFYQTQYYQIQHIHPVCFWGYILCLEEFAVSGGVDVYERALKHHGEKATVFLKLHVKEDVDHTAEAYQVLEGLDDSQVNVILENMKLSCDLYQAIFRQINQQSQSMPSEQAA